jgi:hypothetical protein
MTKLGLINSFRKGTPRVFSGLRPFGLTLSEGYVRAKLGLFESKLGLLGLITKPAHGKRLERGVLRARFLCGGWNRDLALTALTALTRAEGAK